MLRYWRVWVTALTACLTAVSIAMLVTYGLFSLFSLEKMVGESAMSGLVALIVTTWDYIRFRNGIIPSFRKDFLFIFGVCFIARILLAILGTMNTERVLATSLISTGAFLAGTGLAHFIYCKSLFCPYHVRILDTDTMG